MKNNILANVSRLTVVLVCASFMMSTAQAQGTDMLKFDVQIAETHLLGEKVPLVVSLTNEGGKTKTKDIQMTKFRLTLSGTFSQKKGREVQEYTYDGTNGVGWSSTREGGVTEWGTYNKPEVALAYGESTQFDLHDVAGLFRDVDGLRLDELPPGSYTLTAEHDNGQTVTRKFKVVIDPEKTIPMLIAKLGSKEFTDHRRAFAHLRRIDKQKLIQALEEQRYSEDESLRERAESYLDTLETMERPDDDQPER